MSEFAKRSIGVGFRIGKVNFDASKVTDKIDPIKRRFLYKFGGLTKTIARRSIRPGGKGNKISKPGEAPRYHGRSLFKKQIVFNVNYQTENVMIGPMGKNSKGGHLLGTLEYGGDAVSKKGKSFRVEARPFMNPAFKTAKTKISKLWSEAGG